MFDQENDNKLKLESIQEEDYSKENDEPDI